MSHVALIFGGPSAEHDVSLVSARNIYKALSQAQVKTTCLGITKDKTWKLIKSEELLGTDFVNPLELENTGIEVQLSNDDGQIFLTSVSGSEEKVGPIDLAYPIIHGPYGEDGKLQRDLNELGLDFIGSDFLACENAMDKAKTKDLIKANNIPQVPYLVFSDENPNFSDIESQLGIPFFVKPANMGSSVGIAKVRTEAELQAAIAEARIHDKKIVIEKGVQAREIEFAVMEDDGIQITGPGEIKPNHEFYSYEAKYLDPNGAELIIPADVDPHLCSQMQQTAKDAFKALGCRDYARADFFLCDDRTFYFNEINTYPGCTGISLFPLLWKHEGQSFKEVVIKLINNVRKRKTDT